MALVSVIVPVYNAEQFIADTIENLISQTLSDIEIILVDDGSTDRSGEICSQYAEKYGNITLLRRKNGGVSSARNAGLAAATGKYIGFCDADDVPDNDLYEFLYKMIKENNSDIAIIDTYILTDDKSKVFSSDNSTVFLNSRKDIIREFLDGRFGEAIYTNLYSAEICKDVKFEEGRKINEDKKYFFDCLMKSNSVYYKSIGKYGYYRHMGSSSLSEFSDKFFDYLYFMKKISGEVRSTYPELEEYVLKNELTTYLTLLTLICTLNARKKYKSQFNETASAARSFSFSFCRKHLAKKTFMKWVCLKLGSSLFSTAVKLFARL